MKFEQLSTKDLKYTYQVTIPTVDVEERIQKHLKNYGKTLKIPGFRQGMVPPVVIETRFGVRAQELALADLMEVANAALVKQYNLKPSAEPEMKIITFKRGEDLVYTYTVEVIPNFEIQDFKDVDLVKYIVKVDEKTVAARLEKIRKERIQYGPLKNKRPVQEKDLVSVILTTCIKGKPLQGFNNQSWDIFINLSENPFIFQEIVKALTGLNAGQELTVTHLIPKKFPERKLIGQTAESHVKILKIEEPQPAMLNDKLAEELGWENLEVMQENVRAYIEGEYKTLSQMLLKRRILDVLDKKYTFQLPQAMVEEEFKAIWKRLQDEIDRVRSRGELLEEGGDADERDLHKEYQAIAERRVRLGLVISEIGHKHELHLSEKEMLHILTREAMRYPGREEEVVKYYRQHPAALNRLMAPALEDKVVDFLALGAKVKEKTVDWTTFKEEIRGVLPTSLEDDEDERSVEKISSEPADKTADAHGKKERFSKESTAKKTG